MARGWESKSVESQQDDAAQRATRGPALSPEQQQRVARQGAIELALARVRDQLGTARNPAHRQMLEQAQAALEAELEKLDQSA